MEKPAIKTAVDLTHLKDKTNFNLKMFMNFILLGACVVPGAVIGNHCTVLDENSILNRESFNPEIPKCQNVVEGHYSFNAKFVTQNLRLLQRFSFQ